MERDSKMWPAKSAPSRWMGAGPCAPATQGGLKETCSALYFVCLALIWVCACSDWNGFCSWDRHQQRNKGNAAMFVWPDSMQRHALPTTEPIPPHPKEAAAEERCCQ
jgi:hypothetical protein